MPSDSNENLQTLLTKLDSLLMDGFQKYRGLRDGYFKSKDEIGFDYQVFQKSSLELVN